MIEVRRPRFMVVWLLFGAGFMAFEIAAGKLDYHDLAIRAPAALLILLDAGLTLQSAITYNQWIWPCREHVPKVYRLVFFKPSVLWAAAAGYYIIAFWVLIAIMAAPDAAVPATAYLFLSGYALVAVWKIGFLMAADRLATVLSDEAE